MKKNRIFGGLFLLAVATVLLLLGFGGHLLFPMMGLTAGQVTGAILCLLWGIYMIVTRSFHLLYLPAGLLYLLFEKNIADALGVDSPMISHWLLILAVILLCIGTEKLLPKSRYSAGKNSGECLQDDDEETPGNKNSMGNYIRYVDASDLESHFFENNMGKLELFIENEDAYPGGQTMKLGNNLGNLVVHVPASWNVAERDVENQLGRVDIRPNSNPSGKQLFIHAENNLGYLQIVSP